MGNDESDYGNEYDSQEDYGSELDDLKAANALKKQEIAQESEEEHEYYDEYEDEEFSVEDS